MADGRIGGVASAIHAWRIATGGAPRYGQVSLESGGRNGREAAIHRLGPHRHTMRTNGRLLASQRASRVSKHFSGEPQNLTRVPQKKLHPFGQKPFSQKYSLPEPFRTLMKLDVRI
jgi:hypothetical protein